MTAAIIDSETTGKVEPEVIEVAWVELEWGTPTSITAEPALDEDSNEILVQTIHVQRFKPSKPIELGALATHGIMEEMLADAEPSCLCQPPECEFWIGANCEYDWEAMGSPPVKRIDTCALARHLWPTLDCYSQSALLYHLDRANARERLKNAHSAAADILICKTILDAEIAEINRGENPVNSWEELWQRSEIARIPTKMPWGKHRDMPIKDLPRDYVAWCLRLPDLDKYMREALTGKKPEARLL